MPEKKTVATKKTAVKKAPAKKAARTGTSYECEVCGLAVTIDEDCGCVEECDIVCCGEAMVPKKSKAAKPAAKTKAKAKAA